MPTTKKAIIGKIICKINFPIVYANPFKYEVRMYFITTVKQAFISKTYLLFFKGSKPNASKTSTPVISPSKYHITFCKYVFISFSGK